MSSHRSITLPVQPIAVIHGLPVRHSLLPLTNARRGFSNAYLPLSIRNTPPASLNQQVA